MLIDTTVLVTKYAEKDAIDNEKMASFGHLGTHFDVMNKEFPLDFVQREGISRIIYGGIYERLGIYNHKQIHARTG